MYAKILSVMTAVLLTAACGGSHKPAENAEHRTAGEKVDDAADKAEDSAEKATERAGEAAEDAGDKAKAKTRDEEWLAASVGNKGLRCTRKNLPNRVTTSESGAS